MSKRILATEINQLTEDEIHDIREIPKRLNFESNRDDKKIVEILKTGIVSLKHF